MKKINRFQYFLLGHLQKKIIFCKLNWAISKDWGTIFQTTTTHCTSHYWIQVFSKKMGLGRNHATMTQCQVGDFTRPSNIVRSCNMQVSSRKFWMFLTKKYIFGFTNVAFRCNFRQNKYIRVDNLLPFLSRYKKNS